MVSVRYYLHSPTPYPSQFADQLSERTLLWYMYFLSFKTSRACKDDKEMERQTEKQRHKEKAQREAVSRRDRQRHMQSHFLASPQLFKHALYNHKAGKSQRTRLTMRTLTTYCTVPTSDVHAHSPRTALCPLVTYTHTHHVLFCAH